MRLLLASASPRRAELLRTAGFEFDVQPADVDERVLEGEAPDTYVRRVAEAKAAGVVRLAGGRVVLAADTVVVVDWTILGKPAGHEDATRMLRLLSGRRHSVLTAVVVLAPRFGADGWRATRVEETVVEFGPLSAAEVAWYVDSGEPQDKAGAYAIQGLASRFARRIEGSYSNVVGLPIAAVHEMLSELSQALLDGQTRSGRD